MLNKNLEQTTIDVAFHLFLISPVNSDFDNTTNQDSLGTALGNPVYNHKIKGSKPIASAFSE